MTRPRKPARETARDSERARANDEHGWPVRI